MLYNLLYPLSVDYSILNIFKYITFRSAWALVTALAVSILVGPYFIRWLQAIKCRQEILKGRRTSARPGPPRWAACSSCSR